MTKVRQSKDPPRQKFRLTQPRFRRRLSLGCYTAAEHWPLWRTFVLADRNSSSPQCPLFIFCCHLLFWGTLSPDTKYRAFAPWPHWLFPSPDPLTPPLPFAHSKHANVLVLLYLSECLSVFLWVCNHVCCHNAGSWRGVRLRWCDLLQRMCLALLILSQSKADTRRVPVSLRRSVTSTVSSDVACLSQAQHESRRAAMFANEDCVDSIGPT